MVPYYGRRQSSPERIMTALIQKMGYKKGKVFKIGTYYKKGLYRAVNNSGDYYTNCVFGPFNDFGRKIGPYEMDICFPESKLDIEIDGNHHFQPDWIERDKVRDYLLRSIGWYVVRIPVDVVNDVFYKQIMKKGVKYV